MKEQVGVDDILEIIGHLSFNGDDKRSKILCDFVRQYLDLKRLDENRKKMIDTLNEQSESLNHSRSSIYSLDNKYYYAAKILESLDK